MAGSHEEIHLGFKTVNRAGGMGFVARSAQDAVEALNLLLEL
jgi:hypothetical protein